MKTKVIRLRALDDTQGGKETILMSMTFRLLALSVMLAALPAIADTTNPLEPVDTSSPSATFQSFVSEAGKVEKEYTDYRANKTAAKVTALLFTVGRMRRLLDL